MQENSVSKFEEQEPKQGQGTACAPQDNHNQSSPGNQDQMAPESPRVEDTLDHVEHPSLLNVLISSGRFRCQIGDFNIELTSDLFEMSGTTRIRMDDKMTYFSLGNVFCRVPGNDQVRIEINPSFGCCFKRQSKSQCKIGSSHCETTSCSFVAKDPIRVEVEAENSKITWSFGSINFKAENGKFRIRKGRLELLSMDPNHKMSYTSLPIERGSITVKTWVGQDVNEDMKTELPVQDLSVAVDGEASIAASSQFVKVKTSKDEIKANLPFKGSIVVN